MMCLKIKPGNANGIIVYQSDMNRGKKCIFILRHEENCTDDVLCFNLLIPFPFFAVEE